MLSLIFTVPGFALSVISLQDIGYVAYHCRGDPCYGRDSAYTVLPAVKVTRPGIMTECMENHFLRPSFH